MDEYIWKAVELPALLGDSPISEWRVGVRIDHGAYQSVRRLPTVPTMPAPVVLYQRVDGRTIQPPVRMGWLERVLRWVAGR